jgi:hypothetical protein
MLGERRLSNRPAQLLAALLFCLGTSVACRRDDHGRGEAGPGARRDTVEGEALRDDSRLILEQYCGACHVRDSPTAVPGALAVFNLRDANWSARMSDAQLRSAEWRLGEPLPPEGSANTVSPEERARFKRYVDVELARRLDGGGAR